MTKAEAIAFLLKIREPGRDALDYAFANSRDTALSYHQAIIDYHLSDFGYVPPVEVERRQAMEGK